MFLTRILNWLGGLILVGLLSFAAVAARAEAPAPWTAMERSLAFQALRQAGQLHDIPDTTISDDRLAAVLVGHAKAELGQRLRPSAVDREWAIEAPRRDVAAELAAARRDGRLAAWLADLPPPARAYGALESLASRYRTLVDHGGWARLPKGAAFGPGDRGAAVTALRVRLTAEGYGAAAAADPTLFDPPLQVAVAAFQRAHDLPDNGRIDAPTRLALDVPAEDRLQQIEANLERWRWLPHALPADRLEVDVAGESAVLFADAAPVLDMKVIVGSPGHRTPMFASHLTAIVFDPPWNVPEDIVQHEILPKAARDPGYLAREDFIWIEGRLQQRAGPKSSLGLIKFDLPSPFGVYLHDTPAKSLFARRARALSHGCMRLEKPQALATALLAPQGWSPEMVSAAMAAGQTRTVPLQRTMPLYVVYWTVTVGADGAPVFRRDIYGWDRRLANALAGTAIAKGPAPAATECRGAKTN